MLIEIVSPYTKNSVVSGLIKNNNNKLYHIAYLVDGIDEDICALQHKGFILIDPPKPAIAFGGKKSRISYFFSYRYHRTNRKVGIMKISISSNVTIDLLARKLKKKNGYEVSLSSYNQYYHDIIFGCNDFYEKDNDFYLLILDAEILAGSFSYSYENIALTLKELVVFFNSKKKDKYLLIANFYLPLQVNSIFNYNAEVNSKKTTIAIKSIIE